MPRYAKLELEAEVKQAEDNCNFFEPHGPYEVSSRISTCPDRHSFPFVQLERKRPFYFKLLAKCCDLDSDERVRSDLLICASVHIVLWSCSSNEFCNFLRLWGPFGSSMRIRPYS